jgi:hypothetical protein
VHPGFTGGFTTSRIVIEMSHAEGGSVAAGRYFEGGRDTESGISRLEAAVVVIRDAE